MKEAILSSTKVFSKDEILNIIDNLPIAIAVLDADRKLILANKMAHMFVNKKDDQLIGLVNGAAFGCIHHKDPPEDGGFGKACLNCKLLLH